MVFTLILPTVYMKYDLNEINLGSGLEEGRGGKVQGGKYL